MLNHNWLWKWFHFVITLNTFCHLIFRKCSKESHQKLLEHLQRPNLCWICAENRWNRLHRLYKSNGVNTHTHTHACMYMHTTFFNQLPTIKREARISPLTFTKKVHHCTYHFIYLHIYIYFRCASYVGRQGGKQVVFLKHENNRVTCVDSYVVQHEALHLIGFLHEQNRIDRDDHVTIHWDNIQSGQQCQRTKRFI